MNALHRIFTTCLIAACVLLPAIAHAEVRVNGDTNNFSQDAIDKANAGMADIQKKHGKQFVVETFSTIPDDMKDQASTPDFFKKWMATRAQELQINGIYMLICWDPKQIQIGAGANTIKHGDFTKADEDRLFAQVRAAFKAQQWDKGLLQAVDTVDRTLTSNIHSPASQTNQAYPNTPGPSANQGYSTSPAPTPFPQRTSSGSGWGSYLCIGVGVLIAISLIGSLFRGRSNTGGGYGGGGYNPGPGFGGPGYGNPGYGGGGGGFGRGMLGGLLGGVLGGYAADQWTHRHDQSGGSTGSSGNTGSFPDSGGSSFGGSFDSGPSDAGQGFGDSSSGGDFGGGGGGGGGGGDSSGGSF